MTKITWDTSGTRKFENGIDRGVLYIPDGGGNYINGYAWQGLTKVTEKPTGGATTAQYADNILYLNLISTERFEADISAYTYPDEFALCDGTAQPEPGVLIGQQDRKTFGVAYRTKVGTDLNPSQGYKIHLVYNALAAPSQKDFGTINDSPSATELTWSLTTTPVNVTGYKPTSTLVIDSTKVDPTSLATLEDLLYGTVSTTPSLPSPDAVLAIFAGALTSATPTAPTYNSGTHTITIPTVTGVDYFIDGVLVTGDVVITASKLVYAVAQPGYKFPPETDTAWESVYS